MYEQGTDSSFVNSPHESVNFYLSIRGYMSRGMKVTHNTSSHSWYYFLRLPLIVSTFNYFVLNEN